MSGAAAGRDPVGDPERPEYYVGDEEMDQADVEDWGRPLTTRILVRLFWYLLLQETKLTVHDEMNVKILLQAIRKYAGCLLRQITFYPEPTRERVFHDHCATNNLEPTVGFHGTTPDAAKDIVKQGPNKDKCENGLFGHGFYVATPNEGTVALLYAGTKRADTESADTERAGTKRAGTKRARADTESADTERAGTKSADTESAGTKSADTESAGTKSAADCELFTVLVYLVGIPKNENDIPVGTNMQKDFGFFTENGKQVLDADGKPKPNMLLRNPSGSILCVKPCKENPLLLAKCLFEFPLEEPSDQALRSSYFPRRVWQQLQQLFPGLKERQKRLKSS